MKCQQLFRVAGVDDASNQGRLFNPLQCIGDGGTMAGAKCATILEGEPQDNASILGGLDIDVLDGANLVELVKL